MRHNLIRLPFNVRLVYILEETPRSIEANSYRFPMESNALSVCALQIQSSLSTDETFCAALTPQVVAWNTMSDQRCPSVMRSALLRRQQPRSVTSTASPLAPLGRVVVATRPWRGQTGAVEWHCCVQSHSDDVMITYLFTAPSSALRSGIVVLNVAYSRSTISVPECNDLPFSLSSG